MLSKMHKYQYSTYRLFWDWNQLPFIVLLLWKPLWLSTLTIRSGAHLNFQLHTTLGEQCWFALLPRVPHFLPPPPADSYSVVDEGLTWYELVTHTSNALLFPNHAFQHNLRTLFSAYNYLYKNENAIRRAESFRTSYYWNMMWSPWPL